MPKFSEASKGKLATCHSDLQRVFEEVVTHFDCTILNGYRPELAQERMFREGLSKAHFGESPHNFRPALAVDVAPYPIDWKDRERFTFFAGQVIATARGMGIYLKWGGDWDRDTHLSDNRFDDFPHFEIVGWREIVK